MPPRDFALRSLTIGNGGSLESTAELSSVKPGLRMNVTNSVKLLPGGKVKANWIDITAKSLAIDGSGEISAAEAGFLQGPGAGLGEFDCHFFDFCSSFEDTKSFRKIESESEEFAYGVILKRQLFFRMKLKLMANRELLEFSQ